MGAWRAAVAWSVVAMSLAACGTSERAMPQPDASVPMSADTDSDWLCDSTERAAGTDPEEPDSDGDRLLDGLELQYGLNPLDDADPGVGRIVFLTAEPGGTAEVELYVMVEGAGEAFAGELSAWPTLDPSWPGAEAYFAGAVAISAEPPDHVFGFPDNGDRIESVVGETRLGFRLRFRYPAEAAASCGQAVPFTYAIKRQDGARFGDRNYTLIIAPDTDPTAWCPASSCW